ncbi:MAG: LamG-like jellyroll fold domain-containing protein [Sedimentisphaerales bacterium]
MKAQKLSAIILILTAFFAIPEISYGCYNPPPTVYITYPANGDAFTRGSDKITITANAWDFGGSVTKVKFYDGSTLLGDTPPTPPSQQFTYTWNIDVTVPIGNHTLKAIAYDNGTPPATSYSTVNITIGVIRYVDTHVIIGGNNDGTSWTNAFKYLQDAIDVNQPGDQIWVAEGTYYPDEDNRVPRHTKDLRTEYFRLHDGVKLYGGFEGGTNGETTLEERNWVEHKTTLSGDIGKDDNGGAPDNENSYHVVKSITASKSAVLDGFNIKGGNANGTRLDTLGGGMYNSSGGGPTITNCAFSDNAATSGAAIYNSGSSPALTNCVFSKNSAYNGGAIYNNASSPILTNCTLSANNANNTTGYGGAIYNYHSSPAVINSIIWGNTAKYNNSIYNDNGSCNPDTGLVSWWKLDGTAVDPKGGNNGTIYGEATWATGQINGALDFNGVHDYVDVGDKDSLDFGHTDSFTISLWFKRDVTYADHTLISKREVIDGTHNEGYSWRIYNNHLYAGIEGTDNICPTITGSTTIKANQWYHAAFVRDATHKIYLYLNGVSDATPVTDTTTGSLANDYHFMIGKWEYYGLYFDGLIDDVRVYNRALTEDEVRSLSRFVCYSDIEGCGGSPPSGTWDPYFGIDGGGNIKTNPEFINTYAPADPDPAGPDGVFGTTDDGLCLRTDSPCIDAADGNVAPSTDILGHGRVDIGYVNNTGIGHPINYVDMGAYEQIDQVPIHQLKVSGGEDHTLLIKMDESENSSVWACGYNRWGPLGNPDYCPSYPDEEEAFTNFIVPVKGGAMVTDYLENISFIDAGYYHSLACDKSESKLVWAWGTNTYGQIGNTDVPRAADGDPYDYSARRTTPIEVRKGAMNSSSNFLENIVRVSAGRSGEYSLALDSAGRAWAWGRNDKGQLGNNKDADDYSHMNEYEPVPVAVVAGEQSTQPGYSGGGFLEHITDIDAGISHSIALDNSGHVWCWGYNSYGQLGNGTSGSGTDSPVPVQVHDEVGTGVLGNIIDVAVSSGFDGTYGEYGSSYALDKNGNVWAWGNNAGNTYDPSGQLGHGYYDSDPHSTPVRVLKGEMPMPPTENFLKNIIAISAGNEHVLALDNTGNVWAWGNNENGRLGDGTYTNRYTPVQVKKINAQSGFLTDIFYIDAGLYHSLAIDKNGNFWAWGSNANSQLGLGPNPGDTKYAQQMITETPPNDNCADAFPAAVGKEYSGYLPTGKSAWYSFTSGSNVDISLCNSSFDTTLSVYKNCDDLAPLVNEDYSCGGYPFIKSKISNINAGEYHLIKIWSAHGAHGIYNLTITPH